MVNILGPSVTEPAAKAMMTQISLLGDCLGSWPVTIQGVTVTYCAGEYGFVSFDNYL